jgi:membrane protein DedA with SNARE-associated domain
MVTDLLPDLMPILLDFLARYGLLAIFILLVLDGAMLMPVLPGEAVMIMAVTQYVETTADLVSMTVLVTAAGILGSVLLYVIARIGGRPLIENHPRLFMMDRRRRESLEESFENPLGQSLVLFLRVIPLTRIVVNIPAGLARMPFLRFLALSSVGLAVFHAGFMWLAYEYQQPDSAVAEQATALQEAYAQPAFEYLQANEVVAVAGVLLLGAWLSYKSSRRMTKYPEGSVLSIPGWLTVRVLILGSIALAGLLAYDPQIVYQLGLAGGVDFVSLATRFGYEPVRALGYAAVGAALVGLFLWSLERYARAQRARAQARAKGEEPDNVFESVAGPGEEATFGFEFVSEDDS